MGNQLVKFSTLAEYEAAKSNRTLVCPNVAKITADGSIKFLKNNPPVGVGIKTNEGGVDKYYTLEEWNALTTKPAANDIVGEYVYDGEHGFVISQNRSSNMAWSNSSVAVPNCFMSSSEATAKLDFAGLENTLAIIAAKNVGTIVDCPMADWARSQFNGNGWLPSMGEFELIRINVTDINLCRAAITEAGQSRSAINISSYTWTSSQFNAATAWYWYGSRYNDTTKSYTNISGVALSAL